MILPKIFTETYTTTICLVFSKTTFMTKSFRVFYPTSVLTICVHSSFMPESFLCFPPFVAFGSSFSF